MNELLSMGTCLGISVECGLRLSSEKIRHQSILLQTCLCEKYH